MSVSSHHSFILSMTEEVSFWRFGKTCYSPNGEHVCVYNPVIQGRTFFHVSMFTCLQAGGSDRDCEITANEDAHILW